jgi:hypothetical protein
VPALEEILDTLAARLAGLQSVTSMRTGETIVLVSTAPRSHFDAISLADRAARTIARPVATSGSDITVTVGIGVRMSRHGMSDARRLLRDAIDALDEAQRRGPSQVAMFSSEHRNRQREGEENRMRFEPVVSLRGGQVHNYEATMPPGCDYFSFSLTDRMFVTLDWVHAPTTLNRNQAELVDDNVLRVVVAHDDPGIRNWMDTTGYRRGVVQLRFIGSVDAPEVSARVVAVDSVADLLPGAVRVTAEERERELDVRRVGGQLRSLW